MISCYSLMNKLVLSGFHNIKATLDPIDCYTAFTALPRIFIIYYTYDDISSSCSLAWISLSLSLGYLPIIMNLVSLHTFVNIPIKHWCLNINYMEHEFLILDKLSMGYRILRASIGYLLIFMEHSVIHYFDWFYFSNLYIVYIDHILPCNSLSSYLNPMYSVLTP